MISKNKNRQFYIYLLICFTVSSAVSEILTFPTPETDVLSVIVYRLCPIFRNTYNSVAILSIEFYIQ